jgi:hypothetical protein
MASLSPAALHEVAAWIQRWQPRAHVTADTPRSQILVADPTGVLFYEADAIKRLVPSGRTR